MEKLCGRHAPWALASGIEKKQKSRK